MSTAPNNLDLVEALQSTGCKLFYQPPNDINIYHVTCEMVFQSENSVSCDDDIFDYEFFYQNYHVKCKLLSHYLVVNMLNKEIYNRDFDANEEILPLYLYIPNGSLHGNTEGNVTPNQIYSDNNVPDNNCVVYNHVTNENARHQQQ
ncbi:hypothetical protein RhiirA1_532229 [Rhizophagus irregularis]|uniref:Uncharacterized protein n=1 Tax=Rhizophagus irregularis TaxID=588596 RepID=A0A2N0S6A3_9GLOM|nr:hypothetical protein RhiirA1_532229 [Rhizophagus irregularis]CAB4486532.1 unnamed protein product [Rhizophagus irregularis]